ncbi:MAG TPA: hypothetical protein QF882_02245, partial [Arenicellales bacterium]|nr:hypothetical protein [Arenicellales bacterium]
MTISTGHKIEQAKTAAVENLHNFQSPVIGLIYVLGCLMKKKMPILVYATVVVGFCCAFGTVSKAGQQVYTFNVCGAPNSYEPGWM